MEAPSASSFALNPPAGDLPDYTSGYTSPASAPVHSLTDVASERTKRCPDCGETKPLSGYYLRRVRNKVYAVPYCRPCQRARVARSQARLDPETKIARNAAAHRRYAARHPERIPAAAEYFTAWRAKHPERAADVRSSRSPVEKALREGSLVRPDACEQCGKTGVRIEAAHADYAKPTEVRWLCRSCHVRWDRAEPKTLKAVAA